MITNSPLHPEQILEKFTSINSQSGAIVSFSGNVRQDTDKGKTCALVLEAYEPVTSNGISQAIASAKSRWSLDDIIVRHRIGTIATGETIVFVAAASKHRRDAFSATDYVMDYLKTEAFFWKKEVYENSEKWIEPRDVDYRDAKRWEQSS